MKRFLLVSLGIMALSACDSVSNLSMPSFFDAQPAAEKPAASAAVPMAENKSALDTEIAEMERLTGSAPRFDTPMRETVAIAEPMVEPAPMAVAEPAVPETPVAMMNNAPTPITKPASMASNQAIEAAIEETVTNTADKLVAVATPAPTPAVAPAPVQQAPAPVVAQQASTPVTEKIIEPMVAQAPTEATTNDNALFSEQDLKLSSAKGCPQVTIMPAARSITYFENELSARMIARAVINEIRGGCEIVNGGLEIDLDILMHGKISDKGRFEGNVDQEAFMTFPYFVAVTTPQGLPVDKKIMATAMRFKPIINDLSHAEKITQFIPMPNTAEAANYTITVGFQLNRKQLEYNRATNVNRVDNNRIAPDLRRNRSRLSLDPLAE